MQLSLIPADVEIEPMFIEDNMITSRIEKARMSYSPNPSKSEFIFGLCGISQLICMFSVKLLFSEL